MEKQSPNQKKIALAQSEHSETIIELMKDCMPNNPLIGKDQWETTCNTIRLDTQGTLITAMVNLLEEIRKGSLHNPQ